MLEALELRLAPALPPGTDTALAGMLAPRLTTALSGLPPVPIIGSALTNPLLIGSLVNGITTQLVTDVNAGFYTEVNTSTTITVTMTYPLHGRGSTAVPVSLPLGSFLTLASAQNINVDTDLFYRLKFEIDVVTQNITFRDSPLSDTTTIALIGTTSAGDIRSYLPTPSTTLSLIVFAAPANGFTASGQLTSKLAVTAVPRSQTAFDGHFDINLGTFTQTSNPQPQGVLTAQARFDADLSIHPVDPNIAANSPYNLAFGAEAVAVWDFNQVAAVPTAAQPFGSLTTLQLRDVTLNADGLAAFISKYVTDI